MSTSEDTAMLDFLEETMRADDTAFAYDEQQKAFYFTLQSGIIPLGQSLRSAIRRAMTEPYSSTRAAK